MKTFFTADLHLYDKNIAGYRGFKSVQEYHDLLLMNWNAIVSDNDLVYIIGDLSIENGIMASQLLTLNYNGNKILIPGNHDDMNTIISFYQTPKHDVMMYPSISIEDKKYLISHVPVHPNELDTFGYTGNIHGHNHKPMPEDGYNPAWPSPTAPDRPGKFEMCYYNVNVEARNYKPVPLEQIKEFFK
jgi:calcineurin-like phosphoesterase family protein